MVIFVRPKSMFLKCFNVMASPATMAGRYNRSRQFSFGRGTVIVAILEMFPRITPIEAKNLRNKSLKNHSRDLGDSRAKLLGVFSE